MTGARADAESPVVRPYVPTDRDALEAMARDVVASGTEFVFESVEEVLSYWLGGSTRTFVAELAGTVIGTYAIKPNYPGRGSHVANLGYMVARAFRGRGIGMTLGEHSLETARFQGFRAVQFNMVVGTNAAALRVWEKLGFRTVGSLPGVFRHRERGPVDALVMFREL